MNCRRITCSLNFNPRSLKLCQSVYRQVQALAEAGAYFKLTLLLYSISGENIPVSAKLQQLVTER